MLEAAAIARCGRRSASVDLLWLWVASGAADDIPAWIRGRLISSPAGHSTAAPSPGSPEHDITRLARMRHRLAVGASQVIFGHASVPDCRTSTRRREVVSVNRPGPRPETPPPRGVLTRADRLPLRSPLSVELLGHVGVKTAPCWGKATLTVDATKTGSLARIRDTGDHLVDTSQPSCM